RLHSRLDQQGWELLPGAPGRLNRIGAGGQGLGAWLGPRADALGLFAYDFVLVSNCHAAFASTETQKPRRRQSTQESQRFQIAPIALFPDIRTRRALAR